MAQPIYALILAGGSGERFWPLSRKARPKQLLQLVSERTLLEETVVRLEGLVPPERILILTNVEQEAAVRALLPGFPKANIVAEPAKRDTAAAVALGAGWVAARDHMATMVVLPADHVIKDTAAFQKTLQTAATAAEESGALVTIGIKPTWACPGFGYIEQGEPIRLRKGAGSSVDVRHVVRFREKPNTELAEIIRPQRQFPLERRHVRLVRADGAERVQPAHAGAGAVSFRSSRWRIVLRARSATVLPKLPKISFDYAIMEKADRVLVVEAGSIGTTLAAGRRSRPISRTTANAMRRTAT